MNKKIIIVQGYLAVGKSTFTRQLSRAINIPYLIKDTFKIALCESIPITNREDGSRFSVVTFDAMMYVVERLMETNCPIIIEGNFAAAGMKEKDEAGVIKALVDKYDYQSLTYKFIGDTQVLYDRYIKRNRLPERGDANRDFAEPSQDVFDGYCNDLSKFNIGGEVEIIDTTDFAKVNFADCIKTASAFVGLL